MPAGRGQPHLAAADAGLASVAAVSQYFGPIVRNRGLGVTALYGLKRQRSDRGKCLVKAGLERSCTHAELCEAGNNNTKNLALSHAADDITQPVSGSQANLRKNGDELAHALHCVHCDGTRIGDEVEKRVGYCGGCVGEVGGESDERGNDAGFEVCVCRKGFRAAIGELLFEAAEHAVHVAGSDKVRDKSQAAAANVGGGGLQHTAQVEYHALEDQGMLLLELDETVERDEAHVVVAVVDKQSDKSGGGGLERSGRG